MEKDQRNSLDVWGDFENLTEAQFEQIVGIMEKIYKKRPESLLETFKKLVLGKTSLKKQYEKYDWFEKEARRINVIARMNDEEGTYMTLGIVLDSCNYSENFSEAINTLNRNLCNYLGINHLKNLSPRFLQLKKLGELATKVCMDQKQNYW